MDSCSCSSSSCCSYKMELMEELKDGGNKLLMPTSSVDELLNLLDKLQTDLSKVEQAPSQSMLDAVLPSMKALIANELLRHPDMDVKVSVVSCISEITRITAPDAPYNDDQMKEIFQLAVMAFEKLSNMSGRCYTKAISILHILANVRSCLVMLDLECDELIVEMFKHFLSTIRPNHPDEVFSDMEAVMTLVLKESEEISMELLCPLLTSVKKENQKVSPVSWKLGEKVIRNCAATLKPYLREAGQAMGIVLSDFAEIVASICQDAFEGESLVVETLVPDSISPTEIGPSMDESFKSVMNDGTAQTRSDDTVNDSNSLKILEHGCQTKQHEGTDAGVGAQPENLISSNAIKPAVNDSDSLNVLEHDCQSKQHEGTDAGADVQPENFDSSKAIKPEAEPEALPKKRGRKPNSLIKPEEGYDHSWISLRRKSVELPRRKKKNGENNIGTSSFILPASVESASLSEPEKEENVLAAKTKERISSLDNAVEKKEDGIPSNPEGKQESLLRQIVGKKQSGGKITSEKHVAEESGGSFLEGSNLTSSHPKRKGSTVNQDGGLGLLSVPKGGLLSAQIEEKASKYADVTLKKKSEGKRDSKNKPAVGSSKNVFASKTKEETVPSLDNVFEKKEDGVLNDPEGKQESLVRKMVGKKQSGGKITSEKRVADKSGGSFLEGSNLKSSQPKRKVSIVNQDGGLDLLSVPKGGLLSAQIEEKASQNADVILKKKSEGKRDSKTKSATGSSKNVVAPMTNAVTIPSLDYVVGKKEDGVPSAPEGKQESLIQQMVGKKLSGGKMIAEKHVTEESGGSLLEGSNIKSSQPKRKGSLINQDDGLELLSGPKGGFLSAKIEEKASRYADVSLKTKSEGTRVSKTKPATGSSKNVLAVKTNEETVPSLNNVVERKENEVPSDPEGKKESLFRQTVGKKRSGGEITYEKHVTEESKAKKKVSLSKTKPLTKDENHLHEVSKKNRKRKRTPRKDEGSEMLHGFKDYGKELVGCRIRVWWPMDQMFYEGFIHSFDPLEKKHKVLYLDGDEEILNLCWERWELVGMNILPHRGQEEDVPSVDAISDMRQKKASIKSKTSIKQEKMDYLSKRSGASTSRSNVKAPKSGSKPTEDSVADTLNIVDKLEDDTSEPREKLNDGQNFTGKSKAETPRTILKIKRDTFQIVTKGESAKVGGTSQIITKSGSAKVGDTSQIITKGESAKAGDTSQIISKSENNKVDSESNANNDAKQKHLSSQAKSSGDMGKEKLTDPVDTQETETPKPNKKRRRLVKSCEYRSLSQADPMQS